MRIKDASKNTIFNTARLILLAVFILSSVWTHGAIVPVSLTCEHMKDPSVVDIQSPRLSWINTTPVDYTRGEYQQAYRICVSSSKAKLLKGSADIWDSGKRISSASYLIPYGGPKLQSGRDYWWRVMVWNRNGIASKWSSPAHWGMGLLSSNEWKAKWIGATWNGTAPLIRKSFRLKSDIASAKAFVTGLGYFELYINGTKVGNDCLVPNFTNYSAREGLRHAPIAIDDKFRDYRVLYLAYDITSLLNIKDNAVGAIVGNGFYDCNSPWVCSFGHPCFLCQIEITYKNGRKETICSDESWKVKKSPIVMNGVYDGEIYDANKETKGWSTAVFDDSSWEHASFAKAPTGKLTANMSPTDKVMEVLHPVSLFRQNDGSYLVDFGKEISGWIHFKNIQGRKGDTLDVKYICESPLGVQKYIYKGKEKESYAPRFTWYVFRKAIIKGADHLLSDELTAEAVNTDVKQTSEFRTSNELFNKINEIWQRSEMDNLHGCIPSDCPHRERSPYTGDGQVSCVTVMHNFDAAAFYQKWVRDIRDCQNTETGYVPNGAPWQPRCGGGVTFGAAMNIIPWEYYVHYGDIRMLKDNYFAMKEQVRYMLTWLTKDGTMYAQKTNIDSKEPNYWLNLGDWSPAFKLPSDELVHTFFLWHCADFTAKAAKALKNDADYTYYAKIADDVKTAFNRKFYDAANKTYGDYGSNIYALYMGIPADRYNDVMNTEREEITKKYNGHLNTGIFATQLLFETLSANGMNDVAYEAMNKKDFPSYGNWIAQGATTTWEQWDGGNSRNHPMFGGGLTWFYRTLAGVWTDDSEPGYKHIIIKPVLSDKLDNVYYSNITPYGKVISSIRQTPGKVEIEVLIPVGSHATIYLPAKNISKITESGKPLGEVKEIKIVEKEDSSCCAVNIPQGNYHFSIIK